MTDETKDQYLKRTSNRMTHDLIDYLQQGCAEEAGIVMAKLFMECIPTHEDLDEVIQVFGGAFDMEVGL